MGGSGGLFGERLVSWHFRFQGAHQQKKVRKKVPFFACTSYVCINSIQI
jgi:hypothetical protein